jgi:hypothetical protein
MEMQNDLQQTGDTTPPPIPLQSLVRERKRGFLMTAALIAAGYDDPELVDNCDRGERNGAVVRGVLVMMYTCMLGGEFSFIGHSLAHSSFDPRIILCAVFLAVFMGLADHYALVRAAIFPIGMRSLRHGGFPIDIPIGAGPATRACVRARASVTFLLAGVIALFFGLHYNEAAISRRLAANDLQGNLQLAQRAEKAQDSKRETARKRYESAVASEQALGAENDRLVKQANRSSSNASATRLSANEERLDKAKAAVADRKRELDALDANRANEVEGELKQSPLYAPADRSLIAEIRAFGGEIHDNRLAAVPLAIITLVITSFDFIVLTVLRGISMPSTYCMADTRRHLKAMVRDACGATAEAGMIDPSPPLAPEDEPPKDPPPQPPSGAAMPKGDLGRDGEAPPPRRGRGRPRKNGSDQIKNGKETGHEG